MSRSELTTNLLFEHWTEVLGNERLTGALLDQITHRVHIIEANGESYRLRDAKKRARNQRRKQPWNRAPPRGEGFKDKKPNLTCMNMEKAR